MADADTCTAFPPLPAADITGGLLSACAPEPGVFPDITVGGGGAPARLCPRARGSPRTSHTDPCNCVDSLEVVGWFETHLCANCSGDQASEVGGAPAMCQAVLGALGRRTLTQCHCEEQAGRLPP